MHLCPLVINSPTNLSRNAQDKAKKQELLSRKSICHLFKKKIREVDVSSYSFSVLPWQEGETACNHVLAGIILNIQMPSHWFRGAIVSAWGKASETD